MVPAEKGERAAARLVNRERFREPFRAFNSTRFVVRKFVFAAVCALLLLLQTAFIDELFPLYDVGAEEFLERRGVFANRFESNLAHLSLGIRVPRDFHQGSAELLTDRWR